MTETGREGMHMDKPQRKWLVRHAGKSRRVYTKHVVPKSKRKSKWRW